jgi:hypothetical protein
MNRAVFLAGTGGWTQTSPRPAGLRGTAVERELNVLSARESGKKLLEEQKRQRDEATVRRLETSARNARIRAPRPPLPATIKPAHFFVSDNVDRSLFPGRRWWFALYFFNLIRWRQITWHANAKGFSQLHYALVTKVICKPKNGLSLRFFDRLPPQWGSGA